MIDQEIRALKGPIVVFGAGGFVGANLFRKLSAVRDDVYAITHQEFVPWRLVDMDTSKVIHCDVSVPKDVQDLFSQHQFQTIFFLAAYGGYSRQTDVKKIYGTNFVGLLNVLQTATDQGFSSFVHAGSSSEYGTNSAAPAESSSLIPNSHYSVSKVSASYLLQFWNKQYNLPVINLRYYSVYGPWEEPSRLIPTLIKAGWEKRYPPLVDPDVSRDFIYVDDAVEATILAATKGVSKVPGESLNIATGKKTTIRDMVEEAKSIFQISQSPEWSSMENRSWDRKDWYGDPSKATEVLGWKASVSLRQGLEKTSAWLQNTPAVPDALDDRPLLQPTRLSAIVACYRDAEAIPIMHERLSKAFRQLKVDYEIIFVNDGSPDNTNEVGEKICAQDHHVIMVEHSRNFGSQSAFLSGMGVATGDAVVLLDGDLQDPPEVIPEFFKKWKQGFDVVYGQRVKREMGWFIHLFYKLFYRLFTALAYVKVPLDAGDFSLIDKKVVRELLLLPEIDQFLRGLRAWVGFKQISVDYVRPARMFGESTNNWFKNIKWARKGIFSFSFVPLDILFYGGIGFTIVSAVAAIFQIIYRILHPGLPHGLATIIVLILFFGGLQLMGISILGEYLGKVLEETKKRPKFIRKSIRMGREVFTNPHDIRSLLESRRVSLN